MFVCAAVLGSVLDTAVIRAQTSGAPSRTSPSAVQPASPADRLSWMAGCWSRAGATTTAEEQWMSPRGGMLLGVARTTTNGRVTEFEHLRIFTAGDTLVYASTPSGQTYSEFRSTIIREKEIVFENLKHDFPQRIGYRASGDSLLAYIEGPNGGTTRRIPFPYVRATCPGAKP